jgi:putative MATE family efflux protein
VGRFVGVEALAAVGSTGSLHFLVIGFATGMCSGFCIPVAHYFGAKDMKGVRTCIVNIIYLCVVMVSILTAGMLAFIRPILVLMNTPADIFDYALSYLRIIFAGIAATIVYNILANISRAVGDSRTPLYFLMIASLLNIGLDLLFVLVFHMGTAGVATATVLAQAIAGVLCFIYMALKFPELRLRRGELRPSADVIAHLLHMGVPMALQFSITAIGSIILQSMVNIHGSIVVATVTAASKVQMILGQPMEAMGSTMATYSSQNLGAGRLDRVIDGVKKALVISVLFSVLAFLIGVLFGTTIARLFIEPSQTAILDGIKQYLLRVGLFFWALAILLILRNAVQGLGYALPAMLAGVFELAARAIVGIAFVRPYGFAAVCFSNPTAWVFAIILLIPVYFRVISLLRARVDENARLQGQGDSAVENP